MSRLPGLIALMSRRGPDDEGSWSDERHMALGFRRLSIIDPTPAGHQPMLTRDRRQALVFNGELYNFRELRRHLEGKGISFRTECDTEVVLEALRAWGEGALRRFNGMFALAWYDVERSILLLARDPMGIKPLYYLTHPEGLVFGSQYDQLLHHRFSNQKAIRPDVLGLYLRLSYVPAPYGIVEDTYQLEPGFFLTISPDCPPVVKSFYEIPTPRPDLRGEEAVEALSASITRAVGRQLISDVPIGTFLSGGVDSPLVTSVARAVGGAKIPAFSIGSTDSRFDESAAATAYARHFGVEHHLRTFRNEDSLDLIESVATAYSEPFADYSSFPSLLVSGVARDKVKVVLSGDGGDELLWGYPRFEKVLRARHLFKYPQPLRLAVRAGRKLQGSNWPPSGIKTKSIGDWYFDSHSGLTSNELKNICPETAQLPDEFSLFRLQYVPEDEELAYWLRKNEIMGHLQMILLKMDRASMYHGLEVRVPLLDLDVVECAFRIAPSECMGRGLGKIPLRRLLARSTPTELIAREKSGFSVPMDDWLKVELRPLVEDLLLNQEPFPSGLFRRAELRELYQEHLDGRLRARGLWSLLALQLWSQRHLK